MTAQMMYELRVLTGLHRGAALPLTGNEWSIGCSNCADLALYDPGIKGQHCLLRLVDQTWSLARKEGLVTDSEGHKVDAIDTLSPGTPFALNGVWLSVVSANTEWPQEDDEEQPPQDSAPLLPDTSEEAVAQQLHPMQASRSVLGPLLLFGALVLFVCALLWVFNSPEPPPVLPAMPQRIQLNDSAAVHQVLERMLKERELQSRISIVDEDGKIYLRGRFDEDDLLQSTERMLLRFKQQYQSSMQVLSALPKATPLLPFTIVQISNSRLPSVLTSEGRRLFIGDEIDGVRLVDISNSLVVFEGEQRVEVSW